MAAREDDRDIVWLGNSLSVLQGFPKSVRIDLGSDLRRLQIGEFPLDSKPIKTVGPGVCELRARDRNNQYRTMYVSGTCRKIIVLHSFLKKSRSTLKADIDIARARLRRFERKRI